MARQDQGWTPVCSDSLTCLHAVLLSSQVQGFDQPHPHVTLDWTTPRSSFPWNFYMSYMSPCLCDLSKSRGFYEGVPFHADPTFWS